MNGQGTGYQEKGEIKPWVQDIKHYRIIKGTIRLQKHYGQVLKRRWCSEKMEIVVKAVHVSGTTG